MKFKSEMVKTLVELQKSGVYVYLTDEGLNHFVRLIQEEEFIVPEENAG